jgi:hypothetical protein
MIEGHELTMTRSVNLSNVSYFCVTELKVKNYIYLIFSDIYKGDASRISPDVISQRSFMPIHIQSLQNWYAS